MSSHVSPSFVQEQVSAYTTGVQPISAPYHAPVCPTVKHHKHHCYYSDTGTILVLFILLVIISRAWLV